MTMYNILEVEKIENAEGEAQKLAKQIRAAIEKNCVLLACEVRKSFGEKYLYVATSCGKKESWVNGYVENDPCYQIFFVYGVNEDDSLKEKLSAEMVRGGGLRVRATPGSRYVSDSVKIGWRKKTGNTDQVVKHFGRYFERVAKAVEENRERMGGY